MSVGATPASDQNNTTDSKNNGAIIARRGVDGDDHYGYFECSGCGAEALTKAAFEETIFHKETCEVAQ